MQLTQKSLVVGRPRRFWIVWGLVAALVLGLSTRTPVWAELKGPTLDAKHITLMVVSLMRSQHLSQHRMDEEIAGRTLKTFFKDLDPWKLYFMQSDVDRFLGQRAELLKQIKAGDVSLAYDIFDTFLKRVDENVKLADKYIDAEHDFTLDEEIASRPEDVKYASNEKELDDMWRKRIKYDLLVLRASNKDEDEASPHPKKKDDSDAKPVKLTIDEAKDKLKRRYSGFAKRMKQIDDDELLEIYLTALTTSYDPHSTYMSPSSQDSFRIIMSLELDGIGAQLQFEDGYTTVSKVVPGGAAEKDGRLKARDRIVGVGQGKDGDMVDIVDMKLTDVVQMVRGKRGTIVRLEVVPNGETEHKIYDITRARIELHDSEARGEVLEEKRGDRTYRVGVINLPSFYMDMDGARNNQPNFKSTTRDVAKLLEDFKAKNVDAVVIDLRNNGGGSLIEAVSLTGLFIDTGPVVQVKGKDGDHRPYDDMDQGMAWTGPLVVLTSKFSASASEIFAGAIQDYHRGLIIGDKSTHGKGTVQSLLDLGQQLFQVPNSREMGALKITMQQFYRPNGESTQNRGVQADIVLPSISDELEKIGEADLEYALAFDQIDAVPYRKLDLVDPSVVKQLQSLSDERRKTSPDFQKLARDVARYHEQKARKAITLNEKKYLEERAEMNAEREQEKKMDQLDNPDRPVVDRDYYFNEALAVTLDYLFNTKLARAH